jgi:hypothetical protein
MFQPPALAGGYYIIPPAAALYHDGRLGGGEYFCRESLFENIGKRTRFFVKIWILKFDMLKYD